MQSTPTYQSVLSEEDLLDHLQLIRTDQIGPITFYKLIDKFKDIKTVLDILKSGSDKHIQAKYNLVKRDAVKRELEYANKNGISFISYKDPIYPQLLKQDPSSPPIFAAKGNVNFLKGNLFSIVGTRVPSAIGFHLAEQFSFELSQKGFVIVSGFAKGIDSTAHIFSIKNGSIGVLAGGVDQIYPLENKKLYEEMSRNGLLISEAPLKHIAKPLDFPKRNRIISALSMGLLVVEAAIKSGSLITARYSASLGRLVFAIPNSPLEKRALGNNHLIREGATLVNNVEDILEALYLVSTANKPAIKLDDKITNPNSNPSSQDDLPLFAALDKNLQQPKHKQNSSRDHMAAKTANLELSPTLNARAAPAKIIEDRTAHAEALATMEIEAMVTKARATKDIATETADGKAILSQTRNAGARRAEVRRAGESRAEASHAEATAIQTTATESALEEATSLEAKILQYLSYTPVAVEDLCNRLGIGLTQLYVAITKLELEQKITRHPGGTISIIARF